MIWRNKLKIPELKFGNIIAKIPIVQGGMGVRVSLAPLAAAVANEGGIGTISSIGLGDIEDSKRDYAKMSRDALIDEIRAAKKMTDGHLAVNIMGVLSNADDLIKTAVREGIKIIVFGAGVPSKLPEVVEDKSVNIVPIISSARVASIILRTWVKRYNQIPEAFILEGPLAGGHLGFNEEQLKDIDNYSVEKILPEILETIKPFEDKFGRKIPVIAGGGIFTGEDIIKMLSIGAAGVQLGTRFVCTNECTVSPKFKQAYIDSKKEDIEIIKSPVGMPGRAIKNEFLKTVEREGKLKIKCPYKCLTVCNSDEAHYCIAKALVNSYVGDMDNGLIFCGANAYRIEKVVSVKELISELLSPFKSNA